MPCIAPSQRPTLPPLHTLDLPTPLTQKPRLSGVHATYDPYERQSCPRLNIPQHRPHARQVSITSSTLSRTPSPTPSDISSSHFSHGGHSSPSPPPTPLSSTPKFRLIPSTLETADAVVLVPPPNTPFIPNLSSAISPIERTNQGQALLLLGPALHHFRHPQRQIAKGARIHPYRFARAADSVRRLSALSALSL